jgi:hypothetical protein
MGKIKIRNYANGEYRALLEHDKPSSPGAIIWASRKFKSPRGILKAVDKLRDEGHTIEDKELDRVALD